MEKLLKKRGIIIAIIIITLLVLLFVVISLKNRAPAKFVNNMFADIKTGDIKKIASYIKNDAITSMNTDDENAENKELKMLLEKMEYKIISSKASGKTGKVLVRVSNNDINSTLKNYFSTAFAEMLKSITSNIDSNDIEEKLNNYLREEYENSDTISTEIEIYLVKDTNGWKLEESEENSNKILNAILPGYLDYINSANLGNE